LAAVPTSVELSLDLGGFYIVRVDAKNAKVAFCPGARQFARNPRALHGFGVALLFEGELERAIERFRQVLAIQPGHVSAQLDLAHCLLQSAFDDAVASLRAMVRTRRTLRQGAEGLVSAGRVDSGFVEALPQNSSNFRRVTASPRSDRHDENEAESIEAQSPSANRPQGAPAPYIPLPARAGRDPATTDPGGDGIRIGSSRCRHRLHRHRDDRAE